jgi:hypothetical protein
MNKTTIEMIQNFISADMKTARNSYNDFFTVGEVVKHQDERAGTATIISFEIDTVANEIKATTNMGCAHIDFLVKNV